MKGNRGAGAATPDACVRLHNLYSHCSCVAKEEEKEDEEEDENEAMKLFHVFMFMPQRWEISCYSSFGSFMGNVSGSYGAQKGTSASICPMWDIDLS